jgi:hypothetical protein
MVDHIAARSHHADNYVNTISALITKSPAEAVVSSDNDGHRMVVSGTDSLRSKFCLHSEARDENLLEPAREKVII